MEQIERIEDIEILTELNEVREVIDRTETRIHKLEIKNDTHPEPITLAEMNVLKDNLKDLQAEFDYLVEEGDVCPHCHKAKKTKDGTVCGKCAKELKAFRDKNKKDKDKGD